MKNGLKIMSLMAFLLVFAACEKCQKPVIMDDPFVNADNRSSEDDKLTDNGSRGEDDLVNTNGDGTVSSDGDITDPNEDEDYDGIVDPDEDEDFDRDDDGK